MSFTTNAPGHVEEHNRLAAAVPPGGDATTFLRGDGTWQPGTGTTDATVADYVTAGGPTEAALNATYAGKVSSAPDDDQMHRQFQVVPASRAPFDFTLWPSGPQTDGTYNHWMGFGYNSEVHVPVGNGGGGVAGQHAWYMGFEDGWYDPATSTNGPEWYVGYWSADHTTIQLFRPYYTRVVETAGGKVHAVSYIDVGTDGTGGLTVSQGGFSNPLFVVGPANGVQVIATLRVQNATPTLSLAPNASPGWVIQAASTTQLNLLNKAGSPRAIFLDGASTLVAQVEFYSSAKIDGRLVVGTAALATTATDGFLHIPSMAGAPTGTPIAMTGTAPIVYDTTNNKLWIYNGAWKGVGLA
ncbi:hypothetical protein [Humibacter sp.]|uniref:hypothetical protein n=1 Tax=Humibacter sp. TaxID=1940291 RepID=UPI003F7DB0A8